MNGLPSGWAAATLAETCRIEAGNPAPQDEESFDPDGTPFVRVQDLGRLGHKVYLEDTKDHIAKGAGEKLKRFPRGAILMTKSGMSLLQNQRAILGQEMHVVSHIAVATPIDPISSRFVYYWLTTRDFADISHATTLPSLPLPRIREIAVPLPPLPEQHRIVEAIEEQFSRLDAGVASLQRAKRNLARMRASVLSAAVEGRLVERDCEWQQRSLREVSLLVTDGDHNPPKRVTSGIPHLTARNIKHGRISLEKCSYVSLEGFEKTRARYDPEPGDLLITCVGTIGQTAIVPPGFVFSADRNLAAVRVKAGVEARYIEIVLNAPTWQEHLRGVSGATAQPHLYLKDLRDTMIPLPSITEQYRIVAEIDRQFSILDSIKASVDAGLSRAERLRESILRDAFAGRLVPQDPADEHASALLERIQSERTKK